MECLPYPNSTTIRRLHTAAASNPCLPTLPIKIKPSLCQAPCSLHFTSIHLTCDSIPLCVLSIALELLLATSYIVAS